MKEKSFFNKVGAMLFRLVKGLFRRMARRYYDPDDYTRWYTG